MTGREIEDLRLQRGWTIEEFARQINMSVLEYNNYKTLNSIEDPIIVTKVHDIELHVERENLNTYGTTLTSQATGPFASGKILAHLREIAKLKRDPQGTAPITVEWHLSNRCNHDCPFCTFRESVHGSPYRAAIFPEHLITAVINDLRELGVKAVVYSGGGEPLLYPKVHDVMRAVKKTGIRQGLITNGDNIERSEVAEAIIDTCDWVRISVDAGSDEIYKRTHGTGRDFQQIMKNIRQLVEARKEKKPRIGVSFLLTMLNYKDLLPSARFFRDVGVDYFQVKPIVISAEERLATGNIFWRKEIFDQLLALPAQSDSPRYDVYTLGFKFVDMMKAFYEKSFRKCYGHPFYPAISAIGEVYVCCLMIGNRKFCYGKIGDDVSFKQLWQSKDRTRVGESVGVKACPVNCKLSETNKVLEQILGKEYEDVEFLN